MRIKIAVLFLLVGLCASALAGPVQQSDKAFKVADKDFLQKQKDLLRLFKYVFQSNNYKDQVEIAKNYKIEDHMDMYTNQKAVKDFIITYRESAMPRGAIFTIFYQQHRREATDLFKLLYYSKDWETFYKTACWARENINEGIFVYSMHVAVLHRADTQGMVLPPIYEIFPYYFVNSEVIDKAYEYKMKFGGSYQNNDKENKYYVQANYSGWYLNNHPEQYDMSYFTEDVGLNAYYFYFHLDYPFWMNGEEFGLNKDRRGELYYFVHQQLMARYFMERLSNGHGSIPTFDWREPLKTGYVPSMRYPNGLEFPTRPAYANLVENPHYEHYTYIAEEDNHVGVEQIEDYERRIRDAIDLGFVIAADGKKVNLLEEEGLNMLGNIIESNPDSVNNRFYGLLQVIAHEVLGYATHHIHTYKTQPSAMEHFETALRDPMFYQLYKRITAYFFKYKSQLPHYNYTDLNYPGVKIEKVHIDKLVTYFDKYEYEITNALYVNEQEFEEDKFQVWARQDRLTHKPFTYKIDVDSDKAADVVVRVFFAPKYDETGSEIPLFENHVNFVEFEKFVYTLKAGKNTIERNSRQGQTAKDRTTYRALYEHVMDALEGKEEFHLDMSEAHNGFPNRFILPKGTEAGQVYQFYVHISPQTKNVERTYDHVVSAGVGSGTRYVDDLAFGYPFDRPIETEFIRDERTFYVPNSHVEDVVVYHKTENEINSAH